MSKKNESAVQEIFVKRLWILSILLCALAMLSADMSGVWKAAAEGAAAASGLLAQDGGQNNDQAANVVGNWQMSWPGLRGRTMQGALTLQQDGAKLSGTLEMQGRRGSRSLPLTGSIQGNNVSFSVTGLRMPLTFKGTVDDDKMSGTTQQGSAWTAARQGD